MKEEQKLVYCVTILRTDQNHIVAIESDNYDECYSKWAELTDLWTEAAKASVPFRLEDPIVTAFSPGMIMEVRLSPLVTKETYSQNHNPYYRKMVQNGFSNTFNNMSEVLDQGYSY